MATTAVHLQVDKGAELHCLLNSTREEFYFSTREWCGTRTWAGAN